MAKKKTRKDAVMEWISQAQQSGKSIFHFVDSPASLKKGEQAFLSIWDYCRDNDLPTPVPEHAFYSGRRWRFDVAWVDEKIAIDIQGGTWVQGGHSRGKGHENDCEKLCEAVVLGWRFILVTYKQISTGYAFSCIQKLLNS